MEYSIRKAQPEDAQRIWEIRHQPASLKIAATPAITPLEDHISWFNKKYFSDLDNHCFSLLDSRARVIGYSRFDLDQAKDYYVNSIALDEAVHGQGLGHFLLSESIKQFASSKDIFAEIRKFNDISLKLFQKNDFKITHEDDKNYYLIYSI